MMNNQSHYFQDKIIKILASVFVFSFFICPAFSADDDKQKELNRQLGEIKTNLAAQIQPTKTLHLPHIHNGNGIDFFNVGQGHAVLINKVKATPLLIDAGSKACPSNIGLRYDRTHEDLNSLASLISKRIFEIWKVSHEGILFKKNLFLNVIITHPDDDHKNLIPSIIKQLEEQTNKVKASFTPNFLLGGNKSLYQDKKHTFLKFLENGQVVFSENFTGLFYKGNLGFLEESDCITHLFCPKGGDTRNSWSIIARVKIDDMTAIIPGDAEVDVKKEMLTSLQNKRELESDILLAAHHGGEESYNYEWDNLVNPRAIVIGAALMHQHPKGKTLLSFLNLEGGRIWNDKVMAHGLQYYCTNDIQELIEDSFFKKENRLFGKVPNIPLEIQSSQIIDQWFLAWIDLPIYNLWTTGSLRFEGELLAPKFLDSPHGISVDTIVADPKYLLNPYIRGNLKPLTPREEDIQKEIFEIVKVKYKYYKEDVDHYNNIILKEALLIEDYVDRYHYFNTLRTIFLQTTPLLYRKTNCFQWIREAIVGRNKNLIENEKRLTRAVEFIFRDYDKLVTDRDTSLSLALCDGAFDSNVIVLKTFLKSVHSIEKLRKYIELSSSIDCLAKEMDDLCPFGFPEWIQLERLTTFLIKKVINPTGESMCTGDIADIVDLRRQGKNFKEIAQFIIEDEGFIEWFQDLVSNNPSKDAFSITKDIFHNDLETYLPSYSEVFLS